MSQGYTDYLDFYQRGPYAPYLKEHRVAGATPVQMLMVAQPAGDFSDPPTPDLVVTLSVREYRLAFDVGAGRWAGRFGPGDIGLAPPNAAASIVLDDPNEFMLLAVPSAAIFQTLADACDREVTDFGALHAAAFRDHFIEALCHRLWNEAESDGPLGSLFCDSAVVALGAALLRKADIGPALPVPRRGGLAPYRLRRVRELAEAHLADDLSLDALAQAAGLSPFHFARAFRAETGSSPHAWLLDRRIARAKELLAGTQMTVDEVAKAVGFVRAKGLIGAFKRLVGTTPQAWRNER